MITSKKIWLCCWLSGTDYGTDFQVTIIDADFSSAMNFFKYKTLDDFLKKQSYVAILPIESFCPRKLGDKIADTEYVYSCKLVSVWSGELNLRKFPQTFMTTFLWDNASKSVILF